jgi:hypothetical protein
LNDALYVAGTFRATCFFLPEVLYQVRFELSNAYLHVGKKLPDRNEDRYFQEILFAAKECYLLKRNTFT